MGISVRPRIATVARRCARKRSETIIRWPVSVTACVWGRGVDFGTAVLVAWCAGRVTFQSKRHGAKRGSQEDRMRHPTTHSAVIVA